MGEGGGSYGAAVLKASVAVPPPSSRRVRPAPASAEVAPAAKAWRCASGGAIDGGRVATLQPVPQVSWLAIGAAANSVAQAESARPLRRLIHSAAVHGSRAAAGEIRRRLLAVVARAEDAMAMDARSDAVDAAAAAHSDTPAAAWADP